MKIVLKLFREVFVQPKGNLDAVVYGTALH